MESRLNTLRFQIELGANTLLTWACWLAGSTLLILDFFDVGSRSLLGLGGLLVAVGVTRHHAGLISSLSHREIAAYELGRKTVRAVPDR